jgi:putative SOS response-associated peptidase YedK
MATEPTPSPLMGHFAMFKRFTLTTDHTILVAHFNLKDMPPFSPSYNIAPCDRVATLSASMALPPRDIRFLDWGFIFDDKDVKLKVDRVVTVREDELSAERYLSLFRFKRCLILADGLYVWQSENDVPSYLVRPDRQPFAFAGLREHFASGENSFDTCAIITTMVNGSGTSAQAMPALVAPPDYDQWLSPMLTKVPRIVKLFSPLPRGEMESLAVADHVRDVNDKLSHCTDLRQ